MAERSGSEFDRLMLRAVADSQEAALELVKLAAGGHRRAAQAVGKSIESLGVRGLKDVIEGLRRTRAAGCSGITPSQHQELFELKEKVQGNPLASMPEIRTLLKTGNGPCFRAQVLGARAHAERLTGQLEAAEATLREAFDVGHDCELSVLDTLRRQGILRASQGRYPEALRALDTAHRGYELHGVPGHDPDGNGIANCLLARSFVLVEMDDYEGTVDAAEKCMALVARDSTLFRFSILNEANALYRLGGAAKLEALRKLPAVRRSFKGVDGVCGPRAWLDWFEAGLRWDTRHGKRGYALKLFDRSLRDFIVLSMPVQASGVAAEMFELYYPDRYQIRLLVRDVRGPLLSRLLRGGALEPLHRALEDVLAASGTSESRLRSAIDATRSALRAATGTLLPTFVADAARVTHRSWDDTPRPYTSRLEEHLPTL